MKQIFTLLVLALLGCRGQSDRDYTEFVDPLIGSGAHGHVLLGASVPFGAVQLGPTNITQSRDSLSGHQMTESTLIGFAHTHLSGSAGVSDRGDILFMPYTGALRGYSAAAYQSTYLPENQIARAGYYRLTDDLYRVQTELTATEHVGYHRYTYPQGAKARLLINLKQGTGWGRATSCSTQKVDDYTVEGFRLSQGGQVEARVYFVARFSEPIRGFEYMDTTMFASMSFDLRDSTLEAAVAVSSVSIEQARANLEAQGSKSFDKVHRQARQKWNEMLGTIDIQSVDTSRLRTLYTALFYASSGADDKEHRAQMSAWDILNTIYFGQFDPAGGEFVFGGSVFDLVTLRLPSGKNLTIRTVNNSPENIYIQSVTFDGEAHTTGGIAYNQIMGGGELVFTMTDQSKK